MNSLPYPCVCNLTMSHLGVTIYLVREKDKAMNMEIILKDGTTIYPSYDPQHKDEVLKFYKSMYEKGQITGWGILYPYEGVI